MLKPVGQVVPSGPWHRDKVNGRVACDRGHEVQGHGFPVIQLKERQPESEGKNRSVLLALMVRLSKTALWNRVSCVRVIKHPGHPDTMPFRY